MRPIAILGPQRLDPTVGPAADAVGIDGTVALVTAGWQERESEDDELIQALGRPALNLALYARWEQIREQDAEFAAAHRERQDTLRQLQRLYRMRLAALMTSARGLLAETRFEAALIEPARASAVGFLRQLDEEHVAAVRAVNTAFRERMQPAARPAVARQRAELGEQLAGCAGLAIAGGHVAVLLNRLQLFDLPSLCPELPILAWSAGAMALCQRVVLFHDFPPEAEGNAEVLGAGLGLLERLVLLPHARHRLDLDDAARVSLMARRFDPAVCVPLDEGQSAVAGAALMAGEGLRSLQRDGAVRVYQSGEVIR